MDANNTVVSLSATETVKVMDDGYIQQIGTPYELYFKPVNMFVAGFIGEPPMNFVNVKVSGTK